MDKLEQYRPNREPLLWEKAAASARSGDDTHKKKKENIQNRASTANPAYKAASSMVGERPESILAH